MRLHLQLSAAKLAVRFGSKSKNAEKKQKRVHVLFVTECFPIPNLFNCKDRVRREGNLWLYQPDLTTLRQKVRLPVGSCELAVPLKTKGFYSLTFFFSRIKISVNPDIRFLLDVSCGIELNQSLFIERHGPSLFVLGL